MKKISTRDFGTLYSLLLDLLSDYCFRVGDTWHYACTCAIPKVINDAHQIGCGKLNLFLWYASQFDL